METDRLNGDKKAILGGKLFKYLVIFWIVIASAVIIYFVVISIMRAGKYGVMVKCAPYISSITINGDSVSNNSVRYLEEGGYSVECSLEGFEVISENVFIDNERNTIVFELVPNSEEGNRIMQEHMNDYSDADEYLLSKYGLQTDYSNYDEKQEKVASFLPYTTDYYGIGTLLEEDKFYVTMTIWEPRYTQMAINKLLELTNNANVSIAEYNFRINNFTDQLGEFIDNTSSDLNDFIKNGYSEKTIDIKESGMIGDYYYALIAVKQPAGGRVIYRLVLKKEDGLFKMVAKPSPILTTINTPGVDIKVLNEVNNKKTVTIQE